MESDQKFCAFIVTSQNLYLSVWESDLHDLEELQKWQVEYLTAYQKMLLDHKNEWQNMLYSHLEKLAQILHIDEILTRHIPQTCKQLIIIPHRFLHLLPFHALPVGAFSAALIDCFPEGIRYAPSCQVLSLGNPQKPSYLLVTCPKRRYLSQRFATSTNATSSAFDG